MEKITELKDLDKLIVNDLILKPLVEREIVYICAKSWAIHEKVRQFMDDIVSLYGESDSQLQELVSSRIDQIGSGIVVVMQFLETLADNGEVLPEGMYHFLWTNLEKIKEVNTALEK